MRCEGTGESANEDGWDNGVGIWAHGGRGGLRGRKARGVCAECASKSETYKLRPVGSTGRTQSPRPAQGRGGGGTSSSLCYSQQHGSNGHMHIRTHLASTRPPGVAQGGPPCHRWDTLPLPLLSHTLSLSFSSLPVVVVAAAAVLLPHLPPPSLRFVQLWLESEKRRVLVAPLDSFSLAPSHPLAVAAPAVAANINY